MKKEYISPEVEFSKIDSKLDIMTASGDSIGAGGVTDDPLWSEWL